MSAWGIETRDTNCEDCGIIIEYAVDARVENYPTPRICTECEILK